jgi:hypothetical protein
MSTQDTFIVMGPFLALVCVMLVGFTIQHIRDQRNDF